MKFFTDPVAIVLEADMLHVSILFLTNHARARLRWKPDLGVPFEKYSYLYRYPDRCDQRKELRGRHIIVYNEVAVGLFRASENEYYAHRCAPRCVARMIRDGREMTALHFDEFKWAFQSLYQQYIKLNRRR